MRLRIINGCSLTFHRLYWYKKLHIAAFRSFALQIKADNIPPYLRMIWFLKILSHFLLPGCQSCYFVSIKTWRWVLKLGNFIAYIFNQTLPFSLRIYKLTSFEGLKKNMESKIWKSNRLNPHSPPPPRPYRWWGRRWWGGGSWAWEGAWTARRGRQGGGWCPCSARRVGGQGQASPVIRIKYFNCRQFSFHVEKHFFLPPTEKVCQTFDK